MDNINVWNIFTTTGKLEDYLEYKNIIPSTKNGEVSADVSDNKRHCSTGTTVERQNHTSNIING